MPNTTALTPAIALAHERLYPRVTALLKQVERAAARHPQHPVPEATSAVARPLFAEARKILGREAMRIAGPGAADLAGLAVRLGQLKAALEAFSAGQQGARPRLSGGAKSAGAGRFPASSQMATQRDNGVEPGFRNKLYKRICERENLRYMQGYRDGQAGRPPIPPITVLDAIPED